jgi:hypothetical protein
MWGEWILILITFLILPILILTILILILILTQVGCCPFKLISTSQERCAS